MPAGQPNARWTVFDAVGPFSAVGAVRRMKTDGWMPTECSMYGASAGNPSAVIGPYHNDSTSANGTGRAFGDPSRARMLAISEALERLASRLVHEQDMISASAAELGEHAIDLGSIARCSPRELRRNGCPVRNADNAAKIRWVKGVDLLSGKDTYLPAVMVHAIPPLETEQFWMPISTGAAAHTSIEAALVNGICELLERDAVAITWLQRLPLPQLADECIPHAARAVIQWCAEHGITTFLFDATTDVGIPTVYCVQVADHVEMPAQLIGSATDFDVSAAVMHALLEVMGLRLGIHSRPGAPRKYADYREPVDGAKAMGKRSRRSAFGFLLDDQESRPASSPTTSGPVSDEQRLSHLLQRLAGLGMSVFATDITVRELDEVGLAAAHVVIPELQPMSLRPLAQYRGHPRLYTAPARMGMRVLPESRLNPYPQPLS